MYFQWLSLVLSLMDALETFKGCGGVASVPRGRLVLLVISSSGSNGLLITICDEFWCEEDSPDLLAIPGHRWDLELRAPSGIVRAK